ncbi:MAG: helix-turn-helix domain-containing protein [Lachnospiraceae bacterium]|nr:helix-turn-helix domain-containing protein [Lachnospiraceae bacterium]
MNKEDKIIPLTNKADVKSQRKTIPEDIPLWQKYTLSVEEAARYFRIGRAKLRKLIDENTNAPYILWNGNRPQIKRKLFEEYIDKLNVI